MALFAITEEEQQKGLEALNGEIKFLLEEKSVDKELRALVGHFGITDNDTFAAIASDENSLRKLMKEDFRLDAEGGIAERVRAAKLVNAWRAARERIQRQTEADAEARAEGRPREIPRLGQISLRRAYEEVHGEVEDDVFPSYAYNNDRIQQLEEGEFKAEALSQVVTYAESREEAPDTELSFTMTRSSTVKLTRSRTKVPPPRDAEQLRARYNTMIIHWGVIKLRHPEREVFKHLTDKSWLSVLEYLLGPKVAKYRSSKGVGISWSDLLNYEFEIRRKAMRLVTSRRMTLDDALKAAVADDELRSFHFTLQLCTSGSRDTGRARSRSPRRPSPKGVRKDEPKGKGKKGGKNNNWNNWNGKGGKGKNNNSDDKAVAAAHYYNECKKKKELFDYRHGNRNKCVRYNKLICTWGDQCNNAHICLRCGDKHPLIDCPK